MNSLVALKTANDDFQVEYEILTPIDIPSINDSDRREIALALQDLDSQINLCEEEILKLNNEIDKLTNHADGLDYSVAVISGILAGLIDSFFVGELDLKACHEYGNKKVEQKIKKWGKNDDLQKAIQNLENKTKKFFPSDSNMGDLGGTRQHHLRDFAHHPTVVGLICSLMTQFTGYCYGTDATGRFIVVEVRDKSRIGDTVHKKIIYGTLYWLIHLASDMAGSNGHAGGGTGIPGPLLSLAKELSALPFFKKLNKEGNKEISAFISKLFNGTLFAKKDSSGKLLKDTIVPIDLRTEIGILHEQSLPIIINECLVRTFYSARRFASEIKEKPISSISDLKKLDWKKIIPIGNRTVERMMTIASGTFTAFDVADAAIRSGGFNAACLLRVNFVGVGRFAIAIGVDVGMGIKRSQLVNERIKVMGKELTLLNSKVYYKCAQLFYAESDMYEAESDMWIAAQNVEETLAEVYVTAEESFTYIKDSLNDIRDNMNAIADYRNAMEENNPGITKDINNILKWGKK